MCTLGYVKIYLQSILEFGHYQQEAHRDILQK